MTFKTHVTPASGRIEAAPMVDVMFLLLIFFILSSPFVLQPGFKVDLPSSDIKSPGPFQGLVVTVTSSEAIFFNSDRTSLEGLQASFYEAAGRGAGPLELVIKADKRVPHGTVVEIMSLAIEAGIPSINIATRPELLESGGP